MRTWFAKLNDPNRDLYERRYRLVSAISILMLLLWLSVASIVELHPTRTIFFGVIDLLFIPTMIFTLRTGRIQLGAGASGIVLVFLMVPFAFFYNGGINAGAPNWCLIAMMFITLTLRGRLRIFLLVSDLVVISICFWITYHYPNLVESYSMDSAYVDSLCSLIITGVLIGSMFLFQLHISNQKRAILETQRREITELNRAQNRFFSSMSHEIRTPVNTILGMNEMILRDAVSDEVAEDAIQVRFAGKMLLHLINDILDMSKLESGKMTLTEEPYGLGELLSDVVGMVWIHAKDKGLALRVDVDPDIPSRLIGDEMRVKQILINLLSNAVKYTPQGTVTLTLQGRRTGDQEARITFSVSDTGIGIRKEDLPNLFSAFRRVDEGQTRQIEGTGLGLAIVKQFVDLMGGTISVNSVYTKGSTFIIELPQRIADTAPIGSVDLAAVRHEARPRRRYTQSFEAPEARVLAVDDNASNLMVVTKLLRDTGMRIDTASSGAEALQKTLSTAYDLIFMDHLMPEMDGIECLHRLREQVGGMSKNAKVVALTANAGSDNQRLYAQKGFDGYLLKPCSGEALERICIRLLPKALLRIVHDDQTIVEESMSWLSGYQKKEDIAVTTDSLADLPAALLEQNGIATIPHIVQTAEGVFLDGVEIESSGLLDYMERKSGAVNTIPPEVSVYEAFFAEQLTRANHIIHISISGGIEGSGHAPAREAAEAFHNVTVIDSRHLSSGQGILALEACRLIREGCTPEEIARRLETVKTHIHTSFIVDRLDYLVRANLAHPKSLKLTEALMVHPVLRLKKGMICVGGVHFGSKRTCMRKYIASELLLNTGFDHRLLFVTYVGLTQKELEEIRAEIEKRVHVETLIFQKASPAIAVNCGPGTFGLLYKTA